ncbi:hypothetical protein DFJ73DRAFT_488742 [Zopfochytrium polystomum]|nr:hypothetical protein DFJ73DRAFT_488742 [Zopfochytrium polystomum]
MVSPGESIAGSSRPPRPDRARQRRDNDFFGRRWPEVVTAALDCGVPPPRSGPLRYLEHVLSASERAALERGTAQLAGPGAHHRALCLRHCSPRQPPALRLGADSRVCLRKGFLEIILSRKKKKKKENSNSPLSARAQTTPSNERMAQPAAAAVHHGFDDSVDGGRNAFACPRPPSPRQQHAFALRFVVRALLLIAALPAMLPLATPGCVHTCALAASGSSGGSRFDLGPLSWGSSDGDSGPSKTGTSEKVGSVTVQLGSKVDRQGLEA